MYIFSCFPLDYVHIFMFPTRLFTYFPGSQLTSHICLRFLFDYDNFNSNEKTSLKLRYQSDVSILCIELNLIIIDTYYSMHCKMYPTSINSIVLQLPVYGSSL